MPDFKVTTSNTTYRRYDFLNKPESQSVPGLQAASCYPTPVACCDATFAPPPEPYRCAIATVRSENGEPSVDTQFIGIPLSDVAKYLRALASEIE